MTNNRLVFYNSQQQRLDGLEVLSLSIPLALSVWSLLSLVSVTIVAVIQRMDSKLPPHPNTPLLGTSTSSGEAVALDSKASHS